MKTLSDYIIKPIISEKSFAEAKKDKYTFVVVKYATKTDIKNAVEKLFGVTVKDVYTSNVKGTKIRNTRAGRKVISASYKKARVRVAPGQKINVFEEEASEKDKKKKKKEDK